MSKKRSDFVVIQKCQGQLAAEVTKSHLESEGIPAVLQYESAGRVYGLITDGLGAVKIMVPQEFAEEAKKIISGNVPPRPDQKSS